MRVNFRLLSIMIIYCDGGGGKVEEEEKEEEKEEGKVEVGVFCDERG